MRCGCDRKKMKKKVSVQKRMRMMQWWCYGNGEERVEGLPRQGEAPWACGVSSCEKDLQLN